MATIVAILGAESTGKTTLALDLARTLQATGLSAATVPEYLREFCDAHGRTPTPAEQTTIADEQWRRIEAAGQAHAVVIADTTPLMTAIYSDFVFGDRGLYAEALRRQTLCNCTLLTGLDIAWQPDGLQRDGPHVRGPIDTMLRAALDSVPLPYSVIYGEGPARSAAAFEALRSHLRAALGTEAASALTAAAASSTDRPQRLSARCRECLQADCEHRLFPRPNDAQG